MVSGSWRFGPPSGQKAVWRRPSARTRMLASLRSSGITSASTRSSAHHFGRALTVGPLAATRVWSNVGDNTLIPDQRCRGHGGVATTKAGSPTRWRSQRGHWRLTSTSLDA
jgi:hypothetical protein